MKIVGVIVLLFVVDLTNSHRLYSESSLSFAVDLYNEYAKNNQGNFLLCPLSAHTILSLATLGAKENTLQQLSKALHFPADGQKILNVFEELSPSFDVTEPYQLLSANKMYLTKTVSVKKEYQDIATKKFKTNLEYIDFSNSKISSEKINKWVESKTNNKIQNLVKEDFLSSDVVLLMVNALYFNGYWKDEFHKAYLRNFYVTSEQIVESNMMSKKDFLRYCKDDSLNAEFLELPFKGDDIVMIIVTPREIDGLTNLENNISKILSVNTFEKREVQVFMPRFKIESNVDLKHVLKPLGVIEPFSSKANFKGMSDLPLNISKIHQKSFIEVTEKGATAASSSAIEALTYSGSDVIFVADRPFIFYLKHKIYGIMFVGRLYNPVV